MCEEEELDDIVELNLGRGVGVVDFKRGAGLGEGGDGGT